MILQVPTSSSTSLKRILKFVTGTWSPARLSSTLTCEAKGKVDSSGRLYVQGNYYYVFSSFLVFGQNILIWYYLWIDLISIPGFHGGHQATDVRHIVWEEARPDRHRCLLPRDHGRLQDGLRMDRRQHRHCSNQPGGRRGWGVLCWLDYDFSTNNDDFSTMKFSTIFWWSLH